VCSASTACSGTTAPLHRPRRGDQGLPENLAAEDPEPAGLDALPPEQVVVEGGEVEAGEEFVDGSGHAGLSPGRDIDAAVHPGFTGEGIARAHPECKTR
jgi:hypothetical protein